MDSFGKRACSDLQGIGIDRCGLHHLTNDGENILSGGESLVEQCKTINYSFRHDRPVAPYFDLANETKHNSCHSNNNQKDADYSSQNHDEFPFTITSPQLLIRS